MPVFRKRNGPYDPVSPLSREPWPMGGAPSLWGGLLLWVPPPWLKTECVPCSLLMIPWSGLFGSASRERHAL